VRYIAPEHGVFGFEPCFDLVDIVSTSDLNIGQLEVKAVDQKMRNGTEIKKRYLLASDFDQTLSFNDSGLVLSELLGAKDFKEKVAGLARINLVQQGGELAYLLLHDPEYRQVRKEHLHEVGRRVRLKHNISLLSDFLQGGIEGYEFSFYVISAAPEEVIRAALEGIVPEDHIFGTVFQYDEATGEIQSILRVPAGYGKVAVLDNLQTKLGIPYERVVYVGDGSSDVHVMLHINRRNGYTIAVSEAKYVVQVAQRTVMSDDAFSVVVPILEDVAGWNDPIAIRSLFEAHGLVIEEWDKVKTDWLTVREETSPDIIDELDFEDDDHT
jgi:HAD superfamily phosphoserine phosphatase-like hydrolase